MKTYKKIIKTLLISSLFLFPAQGYAEEEAPDGIVTCYEEHVNYKYTIDTSSVFQRDSSHVNVLVYKWQDGELISKAIYQYQCKDSVWYIKMHDSNLPDVIRVNKKGKVENITANLSWLRADIFPELDAIRRVALSYSKGTYIKE